MAKNSEPSFFSIVGVNEERAKQVLLGVAQDKTNAQIAEQLGLTVRTVETYRLRIMKTLKLSGPAAITLYAVRKGWLTLGGKVIK